MGGLVDTPARQARYLQKAVSLDPDHTIAKRRLVQLENPPVPAPVIAEQESVFSGARTNGEQVSPGFTAVEAASATAAVNELPEWLQDLDTKQLGANSARDEAWQESASMPIRETRKTSSQAVTPPTPQPQPAHSPVSDSSSADVWLVRILVIMVIVAAIVLGILVLLILV
jgi:hypothetical protein